jgi:hypothetical protein
MSTLSAAGKQFSESSRTPAEIEAYADALADMFCAYIRSLDRDQEQRQSLARK